MSMIEQTQTMIPHGSGILGGGRGIQLKILSLTNVTVSNLDAQHYRRT